ncbi:MAG TPA: hypothetical protein VJC16_00745 [Candidatus Nanoarchaeia archaeon]|nr:hypothetical protein [Candidatus Nanoarchaeia archaeon]
MKSRLTAMAVGEESPVMLYLSVAFFTVCFFPAVRAMLIDGTMAVMVPSFLGFFLVVFLAAFLGYDTDTPGVIVISGCSALCFGCAASLTAPHHGIMIALAVGLLFLILAALVVMILFTAAAALLARCVPGMRLFR